MGEASLGTREYRLFGLSEEALRQQLTDLFLMDGLYTVLRTDWQDATLRVTGAAQALEAADAMVTDRCGWYVYSRGGQSLPQRVIELLGQRSLRLAEVRFGAAAPVTEQLSADNAGEDVLCAAVKSGSVPTPVSRETVEKRLTKARQSSGAALAIAVLPPSVVLEKADDTPRYRVALSDSKRLWLRELTGVEETSKAVMAALDLLRRYLEAFPAVMAGGVALNAPSAAGASAPGNRDFGQKVGRLFPSREDTCQKRWAKVLVWAAALLVLVGGILWSYSLALAPGNNRDLQDSLGELYWGSTSDLTGEENILLQYPGGMVAQFRGLYDRNADVAGWVRIPDTNINYPVMNYCDGYYENHNFADQYSAYGQPYFDEKTPVTGGDSARLLVIHGKNTRDEQMFSSLLSYRRIAYLRERPIVEMNTLYETARYVIFAVLAVDAADSSGWNYVPEELTDDASFADYIKQLRRRSLFNCDLEVTADDRLLLLSTGAEKEYGHAGARLIIAARQITQEETNAVYAANSQVYMPANWTWRTQANTAASTENSTKTTSSAVLPSSAQSSTTAYKSEATSASKWDADLSADLEPEDGITTEESSEGTVTQPSDFLEAESYDDFGD